MKHEKITPVAVERDENGYWEHPKYIAWFADFLTYDGGG